MICICFLLIPVLLFCQTWAEKTLAAMTLDEKIGQLFVAPVCPLRGEDHWNDWNDLFDKFHIGNAILKQSDPISQVRFLNRLQDASEIPLLIAADAEWGLAMRMQETIAFPKNRTLGAIADLGLIYAMSKEIGREAKRAGIHLNLAPVADVNSNPSNPIIGMRSFGEDPERVTACVSAYIRGIQSEGVLACVKHFPGHGDTNVDSHRTLPLIPHGRQRLDRVELRPFCQAIQDGVAAVMSAHLLVPSIDPVHPASLSNACLTRVLKDEMGFQGLVVSDALNMKAIEGTPEEIALSAFQAGTDLLLYGDHIAPNVDKILKQDIPRAWEALKRAFLEETLSIDQLDRSVLKILSAKERLGLYKERRVAEEGLLESLRTVEALALKKKLYQEAIALQGELFPLPKETAYLSIGSGSDVIASEISPVFHAACSLTASERKTLDRDLAPYKAIVIAIHQLGQRDQNYGCSPDFLSFVEDLSNTRQTVLCLFGTLYALPLFPNQKSVLIGFENDPEAQLAVLEILRGRAQVKGKL